jgi:hypothetical protein
MQREAVRECEDAKFDESRPVAKVDRPQCQAVIERIPPNLQQRRRKDN